MEMSTIDQLRESEALLRAYQAEINTRVLYLANPDRLGAEIAREQSKLAHIHKIIALFESYRDDGQDGINRYHDKIAALKGRITLLKNAAAIEKLLKLAAEVNSLTPSEAADIGLTPEAIAELGADTEGVTSADLADPDDPEDALG